MLGYRDLEKEKKRLEREEREVLEEINKMRDNCERLFEEESRDCQSVLSVIRMEKEKLYEKRNESINNWGEECEGKLIRVRTKSIGYFGVGVKNVRGRISRGEVVVCMGSRKENERRLLCMYNGGLVSISKKQVIRECDVIDEA